MRKDTADVVGQLREGGHSVIMVTGDALLTAVHVAKEVSYSSSCSSLHCAALEHVSLSGSVIMVTGDALFTAVHVAKDVSNDRSSSSSSSGNGRSSSSSIHYTRTCSATL